MSRTWLRAVSQRRLQYREGNTREAERCALTDGVRDPDRDGSFCPECPKGVGKYQFRQRPGIVPPHRRGLLQDDADESTFRLTELEQVRGKN